MRVRPDGAFISSTRPCWGYMAVMPLHLDGSIDEVCVRLDVHVGAAAAAISTRGDAVALYNQEVPASWRGDLFLPLSGVEGETQLVVRSAAPSNRPVVVTVRSIRALVTM